MREKISFAQFESKYLIRNFVDGRGKPKHTRYVKKYFYRFAKELKQKYNFDILSCSKCNLSEWQGKKIIIELDHKNSVTNDSRISNLRPLCPNCHSQTAGYKNRSTSVAKRIQSLVCV